MMEQIVEFANWLSDNWVEIATAVVAVVTLFDRLAAITPTKKDDEAVSALWRLFAVLGLKFPDNQGGGKKDA